MSMTRPNGSTTSLTVQIQILDEHNWFAITNPTEEIDELLFDHFSWEHEEYQKQPETRTLYHKGKHMAPIGLLKQAKQAIENEGYDVIVTQDNPKTGDEIETEWNFGNDLRKYQKEAVSNLHEQGGGIVSIPTGGGKTAVALRYINNIEQRAIVLIHTNELLYQWAEEIEQTLGVEPGIIGDDNWSEGPVTVATMQSLQNNLDKIEEDYGIAIFDECHVTSAAKVTHKVGLNLDVEYRVGLSATPWRRIYGEELKIESTIGNTAHEISAENLIRKGFLAEPVFEFIEVEDQKEVGRGVDYPDAVKYCIELGVNRNQAIANKAAELAGQGHKTLIDVDRINQGHILRYALDSNFSKEDAENEIIENGDDHKQTKLDTINSIEKVGDQTVYFLHGSASTDLREQVFNDFKRGQIDILISTLVKEGVNIPKVSAIVNASGGKSKIKNIQVIGRALRPKNGETAKVIDVADSGKYLRDHYKQRKKTYKTYYGNYGPGNGFCEEVRAVRQFLEENNIDPSQCRVQKEENGDVSIELDGYLGDSRFNQFMELMRNTQKISYNGERNHCDSEWVQSLTQP